MSLKKIMLNKNILPWVFAVVSITLAYSCFANNPNLIFKLKNTPQKTKQLVQKNENKIIKNKLNYFNAKNVSAVIKEFDKYNYNLKNNSVPRIQPNKMPSDLKNIKDANLKKEIFIKLMLPMAIDINQNINIKKELLIDIEKKYKIGKKLSVNDINNLKSFGTEFNVKYNQAKIPEMLKQLKIKIQPIPISLVLAQAIVESGWGTSRFAVTGNALFGQWTFDKTEKNKLMPANRDAGKTHSIKSFSSPYQSMKAYMANLNRNNAYNKLRKIRYSLIKLNKPLSSIKLANGLTNYSQEREIYVKKIKSMINKNNLTRYDNYKLQE